MLTRILTSAVGLVVFFAAFFAPAACFAVVVFAVTAIMLSEMYNALSAGGGVNAAGYAAAAVLAAGLLCGCFEYAVVAAVMLYIIPVVALHTKKQSSEILAHGFLTAYIAVFMCFLIKIKCEFRTGDLLWAFVLSWMTDTGAYFTGVRFGKHKLCEHISPKKTIEGAAGGVAVCVISCAVYAYLMTLFYPGSAPHYLEFAAMGAVGSLLSQLGDLAASCIKRDRGVKDYGNLLPGHGGLMDRFDSVLYVTPFTWLALTLILK